MRRFYFKNFIYGAGILMLTLIVLGASFVLLGRNHMLRERQETTENNVIELSRLSTAYVRDGDLSGWDFRMTLSSIARSTGNHCFLTDARGKIIVCSDAALLCDHLGRSVPEETMRALQENHYFSNLTLLGGICTETCYVAALPIFSPSGAVLGYTFAAAGTSGILNTWNSLLNVFLLVSFSIMLLALILSYIISRIHARPINEMAEAAVKFSRGDFSPRVSSFNRDDEIGALAEAFNHMADSLERSEARRSDFVANVAHELKTPMTTISGFADGILDGTIPPERQAQYLSTISTETKRLNRLVRSMLELSRIQSEGAETLRRQSFDAVEILIQTLILFEQKITARGLDVNALIPEDPMLVYGDADAINQVIYNLLENAVKFSEPGSELGVSLFKQGEKAYISVKNRGPEIPAEELPFLFDRFHKADRSRSIDRDGYGLGLYIVKTIITNHGEDITVQSKNGATEFVFSMTLKTK